MEVIGNGVLVDFTDATFLCTDTAGKVTEVVSGQWNIGIQRFAHGFTVIPGFGNSQSFQVGFNAVCDF